MILLNASSSSAPPQHQYYQQHQHKSHHHQQSPLLPLRSLALIAVSVVLMSLLPVQVEAWPRGVTMAANAEDKKRPISAADTSNGDLIDNDYFGSLLLPKQHSDMDEYEEDSSRRLGLISLRRKLQQKRSLRRRSTRTLDFCEADSTGKKARVCQNCAKITRTRGAFDECCANVSNAYSWCKRIFDFTNPLG